jgi:hypothetical protein
MRVAIVSRCGRFMIGELLVKQGEIPQALEPPGRSDHHASPRHAGPQ